MRILSCYIAGFGKLVNKKIDLKELTVIKQDNGWGKTTFADFIRCMFYGLDGGRKKEIAENDRTHYRPWSGGTFGGALTFEYAGKVYCVERTFGQTPAQDFARVLDSNQMVCYSFGERAEKLGETLFGMDGESYRRSVYVPQNEIETGGLPEGIKNKLLALLSESGEKGGKRALEILDNADKALRGKRAPRNGKLDAIDARLEEILRLKGEKAGHARVAQECYAQAAEAEMQIRSAEERVQALAAAIQQEEKRETIETNRKVYQELQSQYEHARTELARLQVFFGENNPETVNAEGLREGVDEYYRLKSETELGVEKLRDLRAQAAGKEVLLAQIEAKEQLLHSYQELLQKGDLDGAGTPRKEKFKKVYPQKRKSTKWILFLSLALAMAGAAFVGTNWQLGLPMLGVGGLGLIAMFFRTMPKYEKVADKAKPTGLSKEETEAYEKKVQELTLEIQGYRAQLSSYADGDELGEDHAKKVARMQALDGAIQKFLHNFRFGEIYDYRAALQALNQNVEDYQKHAQTVSEYPEKAAALQMDDTNLPIYAQNVGELKEKLTAENRRKDENIALRSRMLSKAEAAELQADVADLLGEEERLNEEKKRLEKRHLAIRRAQEILRRAQENLASRYLNGVEAGCARYLSAFKSALNTRFAGDGSVRVEENGMQKELDYYSIGSKELVDFCIRIALADELFIKEKPTLILDDPFVNFDDEKTECAKLLVKDLAQKYQIVYLTCKTERSF